MKKTNLCGIVIGLAMCIMATSCQDTIQTDTIYADLAESTAITTTVSETTFVTTSMATTVVTTTPVTTVCTTEETTSETTTEIVTEPEVVEENISTEATEERREEPTPAPVETEPEATPEPEPEYLVYKDSTHYIHRSTCRWNCGDAVKIDDASGLTARLCDECKPECEGFTEYIPPEPETPSSDGMTYVGYFGRVTYYPATAYYDGVCGGSGRTLLGYGDYGNGIRGSVASRSLYESYGYNYNGRTTVYLEFPGYESMNGYYYVDDCCRDYGVIDVFVWSGWSCPFYNAGVITANCYI